MLRKTIVIVGICFSQVGLADWSLELESGAVWQSRNDVQIPPDQNGTRVELDRYADGPNFFGRADLYYRPKGHHGFRLTYAPFSVTATGRLASPAQFNGEVFGVSQDTEFTYTFNSYRATYFYAFWGHGRDRLNVGLTGKIRQAEIRFQQGSTESVYDNLGFVPLIYFEYQKFINKDWAFNFSVDGLAGGPGRAFDVAFEVHRVLNDYSQLGLGYRTLEGGADNDKVFTFSWFNYALAQLTVNW